VEEPAICGWYHVLPHCWYAKPLTITVEHDGGSVFTIEPTTMAVAVMAAPSRSGDGRRGSSSPRSSRVVVVVDVDVDVDVPV